MKTAVVRSAWLADYGNRLDCQPYLSGALEAKEQLKRLLLPTNELRHITTGIYHAGRESRQWVDSTEYGIPFISGSDLQREDLSDLPLISKKQVARTPLFTIRSGYTLITRSGTIGKMAYCRRDMDGMACSEHVLRVVPDTTKIPPGYLYAYLSSRFGVPLVVAGTYGSIIQGIEPEHIAGLPVPRLGNVREQEIHTLVEEAAELRSNGAAAIAKNCAELIEYLRFPPLKHGYVWNCGWSVISSRDLNNRLEGHYHSAVALEVEKLVRGVHCGFKSLSQVVHHMFKPPMFKRLWVDDATHGRQFVSGIDAYCYRSSDIRFVSQATPNFDEFILHRGWVIFQAAGSIYGLFGRPLYVRGWLEDLFCADDMFRVVPQTEEDGAFLFTFLRTKYGRTLIQRASTGHAIPRVYDPQMGPMILPWPDPDIRKRFAKPVFEAHDKVELARKKEDQAIALVESALTL